MTVYAGIGSRSTPGNILTIMDRFADRVAQESTVRTGGAPGADLAFEFGATIGGGLVELYLPWKGFQGRQDATLTEPTPEAMELASFYHPSWAALNQSVHKLMGRNSHQILGRDLLDPVDLVVCWTPDGSLDGSSRKAGGTGQALRIAADHDIPVLNIQLPDHLEALEEVLT